jgi:hypothetical protein
MGSFISGNGMNQLDLQTFRKNRGMRGLTWGFGSLATRQIKSGQFMAKI